MSAPRATMRLQFHKGFTFDDAITLVPYLANLGISHLYASPIMTARAGSLHGYDVIDPTRINPELGGETGFRRLAMALGSAGLGIILDIVPNHMAIGKDNGWWMDVLQNGRKSAYAHYFDIDWDVQDPTLKNKILLPVLGRPYGEALRDGEISLAFDAQQDRYEARYFEHVFPIHPESRGEIESAGLAAFDARTFFGRARLQALLEQQHYRLAWWRSANDAINWRRFFDINELAAVCVEHDDVFDATHAKIFDLFAEGLIDGVRIDHVDGLTDPKAYCRRLRARFESREEGPRSGTRRAYIIVEKILGSDEELPQDWACDGTTGYDFMDQLSRILHDPQGQEPLTQWWATLSGRPALFPAEEDASRREILDRSFAAQLEAAVDALEHLAQKDLMTRDLARPALRRALTEILVHMRVYRTYVSTDASSPQEQSEDRKRLNAAVAGGLTTCLRQDRAIIEQLASWFGGGAKAAGDIHLHREAIRRFQQLSAPLAAKAVEDTAFYRYGPLLSRNDVGFDPGIFADGIVAFHRRCANRVVHFPHAMLASATHDHKRGEDVRARLAVLSEMAEDWARQQSVWLTEADVLFANLDGWRAPSFSDAAIALQMLVGAWPLDLRPNDKQRLQAFADRMAAWQRKALREAKLASDWIVPNEAYEAAAETFLRGFFAGDWPAKIAAFVDRIAPAGAVNGLTQTILKLTAPGVPDIYQGTEFWDQSLVDPDNRRTVDFSARIKSLAARKSVTTLAANWRSGEIKQALIREVLALRRTHTELFAEGVYIPLEAEGRAAHHLVAFARVHKDKALIVATSRLPLRWLRSGIGIPVSAWADTHVRLPAALSGRSWRHVLANRSIALEGDHVPIAQWLDGFPVGLFLQTPN